MLFVSLSQGVRLGLKGRRATCATGKGLCLRRLSKEAELVVSRIRSENPRTCQLFQRRVG